MYSKSAFAFEFGYYLKIVRLLFKIAKHCDKQQTAERAIEKLHQQLDADGQDWWRHLLFEHLHIVHQRKFIERIGAELGTALPGTERDK